MPSSNGQHEVNCNVGFDEKCVQSSVRSNECGYSELPDSQSDACELNVKQNFVTGNAPRHSQLLRALKHKCFLSRIKSVLAAPTREDYGMIVMKNLNTRMLVVPGDTLNAISRNLGSKQSHTLEVIQSNVGRKKSSRTDGNSDHSWDKSTEGNPPSSFGIPGTRSGRFGTAGQNFPNFQDFLREYCQGPL